MKKKSEKIMCEGCEDPIPIARLEAVPDTVLCTDCKAKDDDPMKKIDEVIPDHQKRHSRSTGEA